MPFAQELKRRSVFKVGIAYLVVAWIALQVADVILGNIGAPIQLFKAFLIVIILGFPIALVIAWIFEITPEGIKRDSEVERDRSTPQSGAMLGLLLTVALAGVLGYFAFDKWVNISAPDAPATQNVASNSPEKTIAVLPFTSRSASADDTFFVDGMHDDILNSLSRVSTLEKVISATTMQAYRNTALSIGEIAAELGVAVILEGGLQRAGDSVKINMRLIDAATEKSLWVESFERNVTVENLFAIQNEITRDVVTSLNLALSDEDEQQLNLVPTTSLEAYEQYVLARAQLALRTDEGLASAKAYFTEAIALDADYALAYVGLADALRLQTLYSGADVETVDSEIQAAIDEALRLNPLSGEAYTSLAALYEDRREFEKAQEYYLKAIKLNPNYATARHWYSSLLGVLGREDEMLVQISKASELEPDAAIIQMNEALVLMQLGRLDDAERVIRKAFVRYPAFAGLYEVNFYIWWSRGRPDIALHSLDNAIRLSPNNIGTRGFQCVLNAQLSRLDATQQCIENYRSDFPDSALFQVFLADALLAAQTGQFPNYLERLKTYTIAGSDVSRASALAYLGLGDYETALAAVREYGGVFLEDDMALLDFDRVDLIRDSIDVARALMGVGDTEKSNKLLGFIDEAINGAAPLTDVDRSTFTMQVQLIRGQWEAAAQTMQDALASGEASYFFDTRTYGSDLSDVPEVWLTAVAALNERVAKQRANYETIKDSPLIP
ncbi:MAG: tetratricopeptide repeat protein [Pseudomonadota bacterium]